MTDVKPTLELQRLSINRSYGHEDLKGTISFKNNFGDISLNLSDEQCRVILEYCAEAVIDAGKETAEAMTRAVRQGLAIEHTTDPMSLKGDD